MPAYAVGHIVTCNIAAVFASLLSCAAFAQLSHATRERARNLGNRAAGPQGPSRMPCVPEFGEAWTLSRIAKAGTYARQRQDEVTSLRMSIHQTAQPALAEGPPKVRRPMLAGLPSSWPTIRDGRAHPAVAAHRQTKGERRATLSGMGVTKPHCCSVEGMRPLCQLSGGKSITPVDRGANG